MLELFTIIANKVGVNVSILISICTVETGLRNVNNFNDANGRGSLGICQMSVDAAREVLPHADGLALQQVPVNVKVAALYLKKLEKRYTYFPHYIAAYNMGHVKLNREGNLVNQAYVDKVLAISNTYD